MKRRILAIVLASLLLMSLFAGCNKNNAADPGSPNGEPNSSGNSGKGNQGGSGSNASTNDDFRTVYTYVPTYCKIESSGEVPAFEWIQSVTVAGEKVFVIAQVVTGTQTVTEEYEGETYTYDYNTYATRMFSMDIDGKNCALVEGYTPAVDDGDYYAWSNVSGVVVNPDGSILVMETVNRTIFDFPEGYEPNPGGGIVTPYDDVEESEEDVDAEPMAEEESGEDVDAEKTEGEREGAPAASSSDEPIAVKPIDGDYDDPYQYYVGEETYLRLVKLAADGSFVEEKIINFEEDQYFYNFCVDKSGNIYGTDGSAVYVFSAEGESLGAIELEVNPEYGFNLMQIGEQVCVMSWSPEGQSVYPIDPETRKLGEQIKLSDRAYSFYPGFDEYEYLYDYNGSIYGHIKDADASTDEKVLNWLDCDVDSGNINNFSFLSDGRVVAFSQSWDSQKQTYNNELILLNRVDRSTLPEKKELSLACMYLDWNVRQRVLAFNRSHDDMRIVVRDYSEFNTEDDYTAGLTKLNTEILSGNLPDIMYLDSMPVSRYAAKGILMDLWPLIDADPELGRENLMSEVFDAISVDGKLYGITGNFTISTLAGNSDLVGDGKTWTIQDMMNAYRDLPEGATVLGQYSTKASVLQSCLNRNLGSFVDWSTGKCSFDSQAFIDILKFTEYFPKEFNWEDIDWEMEGYESDISRLMSGKQMLLEQNLYSFDSFQYVLTAFNGNANFIGYPTTGGECGSSFQLDSLIGLSSTCSDVDAAWSFLREILLYENQYSEYMWQFPTNRQAFNELVKQAMTDNTWTDEITGEVTVNPKTTYWVSDDIQIDVYALKQEEMDRFMELYSSITSVVSYDQDIMEVINEQVEAYFDGARSAEETARLIQSRISLYVAEQR